MEVSTGLLIVMCGDAKQKQRNKKPDLQAEVLSLDVTPTGMLRKMRRKVK